MTKRVLLLLSSLAILLSFFVPGLAFAQSRQPASYNCTSGCVSYVVWNGGTATGGQTTFLAPTLNLSGSDYLIRMFVLRPSTGTGDTLYLGYESRTNFYGGSHCGGLSNNLFIEETAFSGAINYQDCTTSFTQQATQQFYANPTGSADEAAGVGCISGHCAFSHIITNVQSNLANSYTENEEYVNTNIVGTFQGPSEWTYNEFYKFGAWNYQTNGGTLHVIGPPQMAWESVPNGVTNHGGDLGMCEKDTGTEDSGPGC